MENILVTSAEQLFNDMNLPLNETMDYCAVMTAHNQSESLLSGKPFVVLAGELCATVTDDFLWVIMLK